MPEFEVVWHSLVAQLNAERRPSEASLRLAKNIVGRLDGTCKFPTHLFVGYWPTTILSWEDEHVELEVFDDSFELGDYNVPTGEIWRLIEYSEPLEQSLPKLLNDIRTLMVANKSS